MTENTAPKPAPPDLSAALKESRLAKWTALVLEGRDLTKSEVAALEKLLQADPADFESRITLLGYYFGQRTASHEMSEKRAEHIMWVVENRPEHPIAGSPF